jgi:hypothetical protein
MEKFKSLFIAVALLLITIGVFAGKKRFTDYALYAFNGSTQVAQLSPTVTLSAGLTTTNTGVIAKIRSSDGTNLYDIKGFDGTNFVSIYTSF